MTTSGGQLIRKALLMAGALALLGAAIASALGPAKIGTHHTDRGKVLADSHGHTLYMFAKDKQFGKSTCYRQCAVVWPPLITQGRPKAASFSGVNSKLLGTTRRRSGLLQVTYNGWPLYRYQPDSKPGDDNGEGFVQFGAAWFMLRTTGKEVKCPSGFKATTSGCLAGAY
jgi:predicted lipoprotein with Yx(FWY)xxD motif